MIFLLSLSFRLPTALSRQARPANGPNGTSPHSASLCLVKDETTMAVSLILPKRALLGLPCALTRSEDRLC